MALEKYSAAPPVCIDAVGASTKRTALLYDNQHAAYLWWKPREAWREHAEGPHTNIS